MIFNAKLEKNIGPNCLHWNCINSNSQTEIKPIKSLRKKKIKCCSICLIFVRVPMTNTQKATWFTWDSSSLGKNFCVSFLKIEPVWKSTGSSTILFFWMRFPQYCIQGNILPHLIMPSSPQGQWANYTLGRFSFFMFLNWYTTMSGQMGWNIWKVGWK